MNAISVSSEKGWTIASNFVRVPVELLASTELSSAAKVLWMILFNQSDFRPISKSQLDLALGVHRGTRLRLLKELRELGLIKGQEHHVILVDPRPTLRRLAKEKALAHKALAEVVSREAPRPETEKQPKAPVEKPDYFSLAKEAWNSYRPADYAKINKLSSGLLQALDAHLKALKIQPHDYELFFSIMKAGIEKSKFWSQDNSSKTLQSIIGFNAPTAQKFTNVYSIYNEGLDAPISKPITESERKDKTVFPSSYRKLIDDYDEAQFHYYECYFKVDCPKEPSAKFLIEKESKLVEAGLDPKLFRIMHHSVDEVAWPTDTPAPTKPRETFWSYKD